jgi:hypothetical protein
MTNRCPVWTITKKCSVFFWLLTYFSRWEDKNPGAFLDTNASSWLLVRYDWAYMASHSPPPLLTQLVYIDTSPSSSVHTSERPAPKHSTQTPTTKSIYVYFSNTTGTCPLKIISHQHSYKLTATFETKLLVRYHYWHSRQYYDILFKTGNGRVT